MITISPKHERFEAVAMGRGREGCQNRTAVELKPSRVIQLAAALGGGFPRGSLVELCDPHSSVRTSLALSLLAQCTERQEACAFVDVRERIDNEGRHCG